ncbi:MAG: von Willebrand factor, partial [Nocardioides sp.]|nr:von Willebrand factor [Nocardioides sp.]
MTNSGLLDRHIAFLEALRGAGLSVSLAEDLDAIAALSVLDWDQRTTVHDAYAATLVKKQSQRPTFDALFDLYFPRLVGTGADGQPDDEAGDSEHGVR